MVTPFKRTYYFRSITFHSLMKPTLLRLTAILALVCPAIAQTHPRLFFDAAEVPAIRAKAATPAFKPVVEAIRRMRDGGDPFGDEFHKNFGNSAILFLATGDKAEADLARDEMLHYIARTDIWANPGHKGLRRGALSRGGAISYDLCHAAWVGQKVPASVKWKGKEWNLPPEYVGMDLNAAMSKALKANADSLIASGGGGWPGGDKYGNNWYSVRYGGALLGILASDETGMEKAYDTALGVFGKYLVASLGTHPNPKGWNPEGYGYTLYPAQFTYPALIALKRLRDADPTKNIPAARLNLPTLFHGLLALPQKSQGFMGVHPDFTDDNADWLGEGAANFAFAFAPEAQKPALKWIYRRTFGDLGDNQWDATSCGGLYALLYYPADMQEKNPAEVPEFGLNFADPHWGFFSMRKGYGEPMGHDVLAQFMAKTRMVSGGHNGPDGLGFRIWGLGVPWTTGSGRTITPGGQCTVFTGDPDGAGYQGQQHVLLDSYQRDAGGGFVVAKAQPFSDVGVRNHTRRFISDYAPQSGAAGVFIVADSSDNGRFWRLNTPGAIAGNGGVCNTITTSGDTFTITHNLSGHRLIGKVLHPAKPVFRTGEFTRGSPISVTVAGGKGGEAIRNNWVDFQSADGAFVVAMAIVPKGAAVPQITSTGTGIDRVIQVGGRAYSIQGDKVRVKGWERPAIAITAPAAGAAFSGGAKPVKLAGTASSTTGAKITGVEVFVNDGSVGHATLAGNSWTFETAALPLGKHRIAAKAQDANREWNQVEIGVSITQTAPPQVTMVSPDEKSGLMADEDVVLKGTARDPDGAVPALEVVLNGATIGKPAPAADGAWEFKIPGKAFPVGRHEVLVRAKDGAGDVSETAPVTLLASRKFSDVPFYGDLANWKFTGKEWRGRVVDDGGNARYRIVPSEGYKARNALAFTAGRTFDGDLTIRFKVKLDTPESCFQVHLGRDVYLTLGGTVKTKSHGLGYLGWGDKPIGQWNEPFITDQEWHDVEISRRASTLVIKRDGKEFFTLKLNDDRSFTAAPEGLVTWNMTFGARAKYRWYTNYWGAGPIGFGAAFGDASGFLMDDFSVSEP